jgi:hypothetical protein
VLRRILSGCSCRWGRCSIWCLGVALVKPQNSSGVRHVRSWFGKQCRENFAQWLIGMVAATLGLCVAVSTGAAGWAYAIHGEIVGMRKDISHVTETLVDHKDVLESHDGELSDVDQRVSRIEGRIEGQMKNGRTIGSPVGSQK